MVKSYLEQVSDIKKKIDVATLKFIREKELEYKYKRSWKNKNKVFDRLAKFITRGKCIRGTLFYYMASELEYKNKKSIIDFAVGIELIHSALLIHDDIMDNDLLRRGKPSIYAQYINEIITHDKALSVETAKSIAISIGDLAIFIAFDCFYRALKNNPKGLKIINLLIKDYSLTGLGQIDDVFFSGSDIEPTPNEITRVFLHKTARYTFSVPLSMAALLANKSKSFISNLNKIGEDMGIVFQMRDDEIGFMGSEDKIGKTVGIDIARNNKTLIRYYLYKNSSNKERLKLNKIFGKLNIKNIHIEKLKSLAISNGTLDKIKKLKEERLMAAQSNINKINNKNIKKSLCDLLLYLYNRNS